MKYGNKPVRHAGHSFGSLLESAVFDLLEAERLAGIWKEIRCQATVYLTKARIKYIPDFACVPTDSDHIVYIEAKGLETPAWRIKLKLWEVFGPGELRIYKGSYKRPVLTDTIFPSGE